jgi:TM2 domain-containing membrane protein YozV
MLPLRAVLVGSLLFVTTAAAQVSSPAAATQADTTVVALKSPTTARVIGIIPGAGHMYAGEVGRGFLYLGGTVGLVFVAALAGVTHCLDDAIWSDQSDCDGGTAATVGFIAAGGLWVWSIVDAGRAARRANAKRVARASLIIEPTRTPVAPGGDRTAVRLGLRISTW